MDYPEEPPKLPRKTVDSSKRVSYLLEREVKMLHGPVPLPRTRRKSSDSVNLKKIEDSLKPQSSSSTTNLELTSSSNMLNQASNVDPSPDQEPNMLNQASIVDPSPNQEPKPAFRPRPKPRKKFSSKSSDLDSVDHNSTVTIDQVFETPLDNTTIDKISQDKEVGLVEESLNHISLADEANQLMIDGDKDQSKQNDMWALDFSNEGAFTEDPFSQDPGVFTDEKEEDNYILPDIAFNTDLPTAPSHLNSSSMDSSFKETGTDFSEENVFEAFEPTTPKPFDVQPFRKTVPFEEETSFIETPEMSQSNASLRLSDLLDFDPLATRSADNNKTLESGQGSINDLDLGLRLPLDSSAPVPETSHSQNPQTPGAYVSLQEMNEHEGNADMQSSHPKANSSLKHNPSFHFAAPEEPPPPLPRFTIVPKPDPVPPPVPPRPRPVNLSPKPSHRSSPSSSVGTSSDASVRSSPLSNIEQPPSITSACLDDLPTPSFEPISMDPFSNTGFGDVCYTFNKTHPLPDSSSISAEAAASSVSYGAASAVESTPSPAGPATGFPEDQDFEADFEGAFGFQNTESSPFTFEEEVYSPERISQFVIPPPGSLALGKGSFPGLHSDYDLAQGFGNRRPELSSTDDSDYTDDQHDSDRATWTTPPAMPQDLTLISASSLSQKKTTRYGYLYKQGGYNANKGWKKRWVVFDGTSLSYFVSNTSQISKRIVPVACMKDIATDVKPSERHSFKFKVVTSLKDRVFIFSAETLEDCLTWANSLMAAITEHKKSIGDSDVKIPLDKTDKEGFIRFHGTRRYYTVIRGNIMSYYQSFQDYEMGSPIHQMDMKLASVKVKDRRKYKLQLWLHYGHFDLTLENESDMQSWRMAIEDAIAVGLSDDTVLEKVYQNLSNQQCADCGDKNPHWASINIGIVLCKNCAGIHRMFDYRTSKVRSLRMDTRVWTPSLIELMVTIGNANANAFWESRISAEEKLQPHDSMEKRKDCINKKYSRKKFCSLHPLSNDRQLLYEELLNVACTDDVLQAMQVLFSGADVMFRKDGGKTAYEMAKDLGQRLVMELLYQNGGDPQSFQDNSDDENRLREDVRLQGFLYKAGPGGRNFERRWCILEHGTLTYYQNEKSPTAKGSIDRKNMIKVQKILLDREGYHFEVSTSTKDQRTFLFSSDNQDDSLEWMRTIAKLMAPVAIMEHVGMLDLKFAGYVYFKISLQSEWQQTFVIFIWRGLYYMNQDRKLEYLDLRKATSIKLQEPEDGCPLAVEKGPCFVIGFSGKSVYIQGSLNRDTEKIFAALEAAAKSSGTDLNDQLLTSENVPVIIDKCITHISKEGLQEQGIYRIGAQTSKVENLLREFRKDATAVTFSNCTVHEVANAMKKFLRELDDSVFERINYSLWMNSAGLKDDDNRLMWYKYYLSKMTPINLATLKRIILHLIQVNRHQQSNQMTINNLATCFAPSLMRTNNDKADFMSDTTSREISIIIDLLNRHEYFFQLDDENARSKEKDFIEVEKKIREIHDNSKNPSSPAMNAMLIPVYLINPDEQAINISVTDDLKVCEAMEYFRKSKATSHVDTSSFGICELVFKGALVRPLLPDELLHCTIKRWMEWEGWVTADNSMSLCAREMNILTRLDQHTKSNTPHILLAKLHYSDSQSRKFKRYTMGFRQCRLALYSNPKAVTEVASWPVENLTFYFGYSAKKAAPSKHCLTFLVDGEKCSKTQGIFGHCISFEREDELYRWSSAFFLAQSQTFTSTVRLSSRSKFDWENPKGLLAWNTRL